MSYPVRICALAARDLEQARDRFDEQEQGLGDRLALHYTAGLERGLTEQRKREERIASDLQRVSAKLVHIQEAE